MECGEGTAVESNGAIAGAESRQIDGVDHIKEDPVDPVASKITAASDDAESRKRIRGIHIGVKRPIGVSPGGGSLHSEPAVSKATRPSLASVRPAMASSSMPLGQHLQPRSLAAMDHLGFRRPIMHQPMMRGVPPRFGFFSQPTPGIGFMERYGPNRQPLFPEDEPMHPAYKMPARVSPPKPVPPLMKPSVLGKGSVAAMDEPTENELFARMVWKKMDMVKDLGRISKLHTEIMNVIQKAVAEEMEEVKRTH